MGKQCEREQLSVVKAQTNEQGLRSNRQERAGEVLRRGEEGRGVLTRSLRWGEEPKQACSRNAWGKGTIPCFLVR